MKIKEYVENYTNGKFIGFKHFIGEVGELIVEIIRFDKEKIKEEYRDVLHGLQLWIYWRFGINGEIWKSTQVVVDKFIGRKPVWQKIYKFAGLSENVSNYCGNYKKQEKVIKQLARFGVDSETAKRAYNRIILDK